MVAHSLKFRFSNYFFGSTFASWKLFTFTIHLTLDKSTSFLEIFDQFLVGWSVALWARFGMLTDGKVVIQTIDWAVFALRLNALLRISRERLRKPKEGEVQIDWKVHVKFCSP